MDTYPDTCTLDTESDLARLLAKAKRRPLIVEANGIRYRMEPEDPFAFYDPEKARAALEAAAGSWAGLVDTEQLKRDLDRARGLRYDDVRAMIREAKPAALPTEEDAETRDGSRRYNEALDAYEAAVLDRLARDEAGA